MVGSVKNWKSFLAFFLFIFLYGYSVYTDKSDNIVSVTGFIALYAMAFMMLRSEALTKVVESLTEIVKAKLKK
jgi:hypothetical protein